VWTALTAWLERTLEAIEDWSRLVELLFSVAAYLQTAESDIAHGNISTLWKNVNFWTGTTFPPRGIAINAPGNGQFTFEYEGVYRVSLVGALTHDEVNAGRHFLGRVYNFTDDAAAGPEFYFPTGRNSPGTVVVIEFLQNVGAADLGKLYGWQYGNTTDSYTNCNWETLVFGINMVSEYRGGGAG
jgi:hypothetical protein